MNHVAHDMLLRVRTKTFWTGLGCAVVFAGLCVSCTVVFAPRGMEGF